MRALPPRLPAGGGVLEEARDLVARADMARNLCKARRGAHLS